MDTVLSTSQQEGVWKCMDTPGVLWLCLDWVMHVEFQLWNLQANSWLMCSVSISPSLAHGRGITRGFWCFWKVFQWCLRTLLWRTTFRRNVFFALMVRMCVFERRFGICFASHDVYARQQQLPNYTLFFKRFWHVYFLDWHLCGRLDVALAIYVSGRWEWTSLFFSSAGICHTKHRRRSAWSMHLLVQACARQ